MLLLIGISSGEDFHVDSRRTSAIVLDHLTWRYFGKQIVESLCVCFLSSLAHMNFRVVFLLCELY